MIVHEEWTDQLSEYLDDELSPDERRAVDAHLRGCPSCAAVLNDLKRVVARAGSSVARPPEDDLWAGIAARLQPGPRAASGRATAFAPRRPRRFTFTLPQLAAAAAVLIAVSGGGAWQLASRAGRPAVTQAQGIPVSSSRDEGLRDRSPASEDARAATRDGTGATDFARIENVGMADVQYDAAVADLEKALKGGRGRLDASTIAIVEHNLQIIDQAINQAREALAGDPANSYLSSHLVEARRRKLDLLRRATALATETN